MVGLVIVSHSRALAAGVAELVAGVGEREIPLAFAGGAGDDHGELGTDATDIMDAIQSVDSPDGVLILMDLGSAILSTETALEFLEGALQGPVEMVPAPLVEGSVSAAVQIALDADLQTVIAEALDALTPKREQLGDPPGATQAGEGAGARPTGADEAAVRGVSRVYLVETEHGLHARPAAALVRTVGRFAAAAQVRKIAREAGTGDDAEDSRWVNARSLNRIATLQVRCGDRIELVADGSDAEGLLAAVETLVADNFGEPRGASSGAEVATSDGGAESDAEDRVGPPGMSGWVGTLSGIAAAPGLACAPAHPLGGDSVRFDGQPPERETPLADGELPGLMDPFFAARKRLATSIRSEAEAARRNGRTNEAEIADAHETLLTDPELESAVREILRSRECLAATAVWIVAMRIAGEYRSADDPYLQARGADVEDVGRRLVMEIEPDRVREAPLPDRESIILARDLLPSQTMRLDPAFVRGIVTIEGSASSHAAIIARGLGIPMVAAVPLAEDWSRADLPDELVVDGDAGTVEFGAPPERVASVRRTIAEQERARESERRAARQPGSLADGTAVPVRANVATAADATLAAANGADGVGLLRTEFIFLGAESLPDEQRQTAMLREMIAPFGTRPVVLRLLDIGGDKNVAYLDLPREANPFLGLRGVRLLLEERFRPLLMSHLRAILRAAEGHTVKVMVPMVSRVEEIRRVRAAITAAHEELSGEGIDHAWPVDLGAMVETPAAALRAGDLARECAFFSIGTNDLTQYVMAAERGNASVASLSDGLHPAVVEAISLTVEGARTEGIPVSVCGELGSDPQAVAVLIGLGVESLSVNPAAVGSTKALLATLQEDACTRLAAQARAALNAREARALT
jgi:phosphoenolpyruvate-protein phosphotransferase/dihydroxyacetone kinase phosphotransfer subunit